MIYVARALVTVAFGVLVSSVLLVSPLYADDPPYVEKWLTESYEAERNGKYAEALRYLGAYANEEPERMVNDELFTELIRARLLLLSAHFEKDGEQFRNALLGTETSLELAKAQDDILRLWKEGCTGVIGEEVGDLPGTWCGPKVNGDENPPAAFCNENPTSIEEFARYTDRLVQRPVAGQDPIAYLSLDPDAYSVFYNWWTSNQNNMVSNWSTLNSSWAFCAKTTSGLVRCLQ
jgi:hypothetical protein